MPNIQILVSTCCFSLKKTQDTLDKQPFPDVEQRKYKSSMWYLVPESTPILMVIRVSKDSSRQLERVSIVKFGTICLPKSERIITVLKQWKKKKKNKIPQMHSGIFPKNTEENLFATMGGRGDYFLSSLL